MAAERNARILRTIPFLITVCLLALPAQAQYSGGTGTADDPYQIATAEDLIALGETPGDYDKHFILTADIDLDPNLPGRKVFDKAVIRFFDGVFDGNGHTVSNLTIKGNGFLGLFGSLGRGAEIKDLGAAGVNVTASDDHVGALVGSNFGYVTECYSTGRITSTGRRVGGLVGGNDCAITNSYSTCAVTGTDGVGGLVGENGSVVTHCYSTGTVRGTYGFVGGLIGAGGGLVGCGKGVVGSFWDTQTSGRTWSGGGKGLNTAQMQETATFLSAGWYVSGEPLIWTIDEGRNYPRLWWEDKQAELMTPRLSDLLAGSGTENNPYLIHTAQDLNLIGLVPRDWGKRFKLMADIDLSTFDGKEGRPAFNIIACGMDTWTFQGIPFTGVFDGNSHTISHLTIAGGGYLGLFGKLACEAEVRDLGVVDVNVTGSGGYVGGLAAYNEGTVTHCYSTGAVRGSNDVAGLVGDNYGTMTQCWSTATVGGGSVVGGLAGTNGNLGWGWAPGTISNCCSSGTVSGYSTVGGLVGCNDGSADNYVPEVRSTVRYSYSTGQVTGSSGVGGLIGSNDEGTLTECYSTGTVSGESRIGGLVGGSYYGDVTNCYSTGSVNGSSSVGGLVGVNAGRATQCYSTGAVSGSSNVGGLVGSNWELFFPTGDVTVGTVNDSFWDTQSSGQASSAGGIGKTMAQMQAAGTYLDAGWDFLDETRNGTQDIWWILEGEGYPRMVWDCKPPWAFSPAPQDGATDVIQSPILCWHGGEKAIGHELYFSDDHGAIINAIPGSQGIYRGRQASEMTTYDPGTLDCGKTYYWRIDEVNDADPNSPWKGAVWRFSTSQFPVILVVDDFESYTDEEGSLIWETWVDGWYFDANHPGNGTRSSVGNVDPPFAEQTIVHAGWQSMPMDYNWDYNDVRPWYSEAERTWETPQDWTVEGADTLTLYFRGEPNNSPQALYVGVEDSGGRIAVVVHPDAEAVLATEWQKWHIALSEVRAAGVDVAAVQKMVIGVGDHKNPKPGGTGRIYIDDIRLTKRMP